eukprot:Gb_01064 [translate_table: standard]
MSLTNASHITAMDVGVESQARCRFAKMWKRLQTKYFFPSEKPRINHLIERSILDAEEKGVKVISVGLLNKNEDLNQGGELFLKRHEDLQIRVVDGSTLAAAVVLHSIPDSETEVLLSRED